MMKELILFPIDFWYTGYASFVTKIFFVDSEQLFFSRLDPFLSFVE